MAEEVKACVACFQACMVLCICKDPPLPLCAACSQTHQMHLEGMHYLFLKEKVVAISHRDWCSRARSIVKKIQIAESCLQLSELSARDCNMQIDQKCANVSERDHYFALRASLRSQFTAFKQLARAAINNLKRNLLKIPFSSCSDLELLIYQYEGKPVSCLEWSTEDSVKFRIEYPRNSVARTEERSECEAGDIGKGVDLVHGRCRWKYQPLQQSFVSAQLIGSDQLKWPLTISLSDGGLFCIGDSHYTGASTHVYMITSGGECRAISPLLAARGSPGAVALHRFVYVLGGVCPAGVLLSSSERLSLDNLSLRWEAIPPLTEPRRSFTPCTYQDSIYICGGWGTRGCEVLDTCSLRYTQVALKMQEESDAVSACVGDGKILIITKSHFVMWDAKLNLTIYRQSHEPQICVYSSSGAVVLDRMIYFAGFGSVTVIDFDSGDFQRIFLEDSEGR